MFHEPTDARAAVLIHDKGTAVGGDGQLHVVNGVVKTDPPRPPSEHFSQICQHHIRGISQYSINELLKYQDCYKFLITNFCFIYNCCTESLSFILINKRKII